jgi:short-subunit dehydrogenase
MSDRANERLMVITGASKGIGRATAKALIVGHGCRVIAVSRDGTALGEFAAQPDVSGRLEPLVCDITASDGVHRVKDHVAGRRVHGLVNNAGLLLKRDFGEWTVDDLAALFLANVTAPVALVQALAGNLAGTPKGHVVNIGSMGGYQGSQKFPGLLGYSASKAALANVTECLAEELKERSISVNCLCLGAVDTAMLRAAFPGYKAPTDEKAMGNYIARFLIEGHKFFNGKVLPVASSTP